MSVINLCLHQGQRGSDKWANRLNTGREDTAGQKPEQHKGAEGSVKTARKPLCVQTILTNGEMAQTPFIVASHFSLSKHSVTISSNRLFDTLY